MEPIFDHVKLDVYGLELQFVTWTTDFLEEVSQSPVSRRRELVDQLDRASISVLLNTAEGNGKRQGPQRARYFDDARGSALECAACLDASVAKPITKSDRICPGKELLARIVAMLIRLIERFRSRRIPGSRRGNQRMTDFEHEQEQEQEHEQERGEAYFATGFS